jgi:hypothetical protein
VFAPVRLEPPILLRRCCDRANIRGTNGNEALRHGEDRATRRSRRIVGLGGEQLTNALAMLVERKWPAWDKDKPMRPHQLARLLGAYGVRSQPLHDGGMVFRG